MKLSQNSNSILFSCTNIPDLFISEYLREANGDYIKVYFYLLFLSKNDKEIKVNDLSKLLSLDFSVVKEAISYWEEKGLLIKKTDGYIMPNIQELELNKLYSPKLTSSPEDTLKKETNKQRAKVIDDINNQFFQGILMSPSWYTDIDLWYTKYGFDDSVMFALFGYAYDKKALTRQYIQATAEAWSKNGIKTFDELEKYFEKRDKQNILNKEISKKLNLYRKLTVFEEEDIAKWTDDYHFNMDIIDIALKTASSKNKVRFDYIDKLLTDWHKKDFKTVDEINAYLKSQKSNSTNNIKIAKNLNYTQSSFDNLDSLYDN